jgi:hypothetical protein
MKTVIQREYLAQNAGQSSIIGQKVTHRRHVTSELKNCISILLSFETE